MLRPTIVFAGALTAALSLGDLGIAALFGSQRFATLPLLLQQRMGSYRSSDGAALAFLLLLMCLLLFAAAGLIARANTARGSA
jgi:thiamine transport system permease protein